MRTHDLCKFAVVLTAGVLVTQGAAAQANGATGNAVAPYVNALVAAGNLPAARLSLAQARSGVKASTPAPDLDLAEARLLSMGEEYDKAVAMADSAMKGYKAEAEAAAKKAGDKVDTKKTEFACVPTFVTSVIDKP